MEEVKKGTTTIGLVYNGGVVLAAERRATMGTLIAHKVTEKVFKIDDNLGLTVSGLVGDAQALARVLSAEVALYKRRRNVPMTVKAAATIMSNILQQNRPFPYYVGLLIGGIDKMGGHVYSIDAVGGAIPDKYITSGSGSPIVYGVLEDRYKEDMPEEEAVELIIRSLTAAIARDSASGNGMDIVLITQEGVKRLSDEEIARKTKNLS